MQYEYHPVSLKKHYEDERWLKKKYGPLIAEGMIKFLGSLDAAESAYDIKTAPYYYMEHKHNNLKNYYAVSLDKKKSKWRLMLQMINDKGKTDVPSDDEKGFLQSIKTIRILEFSDHYGEY